MDVRLTPEQAALRHSAARIVDRLGPGTVRGLDDAERAGRLDAAVAASGWREFRVPVDGRSPLASGVEVAVVAEELGRGLADAPFLGPTLAAELRRLAGAPAAVTDEAVAFTRSLSGAAVAADGTVPAGAVAVDARGASSALVLLPDGGGHALAAVPVPPAAGGTDLTRPGSAVDPGSTVTRVEGPGLRPLTGDDLSTWTALGLALTCADLVGTMSGALDLAVGYASERCQFGRPVGSFQAVQHLLADAFVLTEGSRSATRYAAWAVDSLAPDAALAARRRIQGLLRQGGTDGMRDGHPGARRHRQYLGVPGPRPSPTGPPLGRRAGRGRAQPRPGARPPRNRSRPWTSVTRPTRPPSAPASAPG